MRLLAVATFGLFLFAAVPASAADFPAGTYIRKAKNGVTWTFTFDAKGRYSVLRDGKVAAEGAYKSTEDQVEVNDDAGPERSSKTGTYKWKLDGKSLTFTKVKDEAGGRAATLTAGPWEKKD